MNIECTTMLYSYAVIKRRGKTNMEKIREKCENNLRMSCTKLSQCLDGLSQFFLEKSTNFGIINIECTTELYSYLMDFSFKSVQEARKRVKHLALIFPALLKYGKRKESWRTN
jgi:hypothetical protein